MCRRVGYSSGLLRRAVFADARESPPGRLGGSYNKCVRGQVSQKCGGNRVD